MLINLESSMLQIFLMDKCVMGAAQPLPPLRGLIKVQFGATLC